MTKTSDFGVFVVGGDRLVEEMFIDWGGYDIVDSIYDAQLVCFTGGADVSPALYGDIPHRTTRSTPARDKIESEVYVTALALGTPMVGICRGGQFLNVMNNGTMWQDVDNHTRQHYLKDISSSTMRLVTSTHHQMMRPSKDNGVQIVATASISIRKETGRSVETVKHNIGTDIEVVWYSKTKCLCFQPHPEYDNLETDTRAYFFELLDRYRIGAPTT